MRGSDEAGRFPALRRRYVALASGTFNLVLALVLLNLALWPIVALWPPPPPRSERTPAQFPKEKLAEVYGDLPMDVVLGTLDETWNMLQMEAKPWVHYGEAPFSGRYVNVSAEGVRSNGPGTPPVGIGAEQRPAVPGSVPFRVFLFGGSTMWGYGVPDWETIPAHLERLLAGRFPGRTVEVRNYGRGFYYSTQESALFQSLLRSGDTPDAVIFLDGLNEISAAYGVGERLVRDEPLRMDRLREMWRRDTAGPSVDRRVLPSWLPMVRFARRLREGSRAQHAAAESVPPAEADTAVLDEEARFVASLYLRNKRTIGLLAAEEGIAAYFFWQPVPQVDYDLSRHPFARVYSRRGEAVLSRLYARIRAEKPGIDDLSDMLRDYDRPAFVDAHHYTPAVCRMIAERMAARIRVP